VGRTPLNEIQLTGEKISRFHAKIVVSTESVEIFDLGSTNGTFVNESRLEPNQAHRLQPGDEIRFGDLHFHLERTP
jgi:pSer/pThr/pTyr-binding forkhead associated (FHA) protein